MNNQILFHPRGHGRVISLLEGFQWQTNHSLDGIAGIVVERKQNPDITARMQSMGEEEFATINKLEGRFDQRHLMGTLPEGPRPSKPFDLPEWLQPEILSLSKIFQDVTGAKSGNVYFKTIQADKFHIDGAHNPFRNNKSWRMTFALTGAQTIWHNAVFNPEERYSEGLNRGFPALAEKDLGIKNQDYFDAFGPLIFRIESPNGLFHKSPESDGAERRIVVTFDTRVNAGSCSSTCPNPCF